MSVPLRVEGSDFEEVAGGDVILVAKRLCSDPRRHSYEARRILR